MADYDEMWMWVPEALRTTPGAEDAESKFELYVTTLAWEMYGGEYVSRGEALRAWVAAQGDDLIERILTTPPEQIVTEALGTPCAEPLPDDDFGRGAVLCMMRIGPVTRSAATEIYARRAPNLARGDLSSWEYGAALLQEEEG